MSTLLQFAKEWIVSLLILASTKFGDIGVNSSPYTWCKSVNTQHVINFGNWFKLNYAICYLYNVYGGNEISNGKYATVIGKFLEKKKRGLVKLPVVKPGSQRRNFTYYEDVIDALILVAQSGSGDGYCIGSQDNYSLVELVELLECKPVFITERQGNRMNSILDDRKIKALGWEPKCPLRTTLEIS